MPASPIRRTSWACAAAGPVQTLEHAPEFGVAADQGRAEAERSSPRAARGVVERPDQPMHQHAAGLAAKRDVAQGLEGQGMAGKAVGSGPTRPHRLPPRIAGAVQCSPCRRSPSRTSRLPAPKPPATTGPVLMPMWSASGRPAVAPAGIADAPSARSCRAQRGAPAPVVFMRTGAPNSASRASPINLSTKPPNLAPQPSVLRTARSAAPA